MFKKLIFFALLGGLFYLNHTNPTREDHEALLLNELRKLGPVSEEQFATTLNEIDYSNFMVCSATKTTLDSKLISFGYLQKVKLVNDVWGKQTMQKLFGSQGY